MTPPSPERVEETVEQTVGRLFNLCRASNSLEPISEFLVGAVTKLKGEIRALTAEVEQVENDKIRMNEDIRKLTEERDRLRGENRDLQNLIASGHSRGAEISPFVRGVFSATSAVNARGYELEQANARLRADVLNAIPKSWLDPLLSGEGSRPLPLTGPDVEWLLNALRERVIAALAPSAPE